MHGRKVIRFEETHDYKHPGSSTDFMEDGLRDTCVEM